MTNDFEILLNVELFKNIEADKLQAMLNCLGGETKILRKGEIALLAGSQPQHVGIVLAGRLHIMREDYDGRRLLLAALLPGDIFAEALCCAAVEASPVTVQADTEGRILLLSFNRILHICPNSCLFHRRLIENMLRLIAQKNLLLQKRLEILSLKTIRAKLLHYLASWGMPLGREFMIPFNREELADFLGVERSALSHELARMKKEGLIDYHKNKFKVYHAHLM